jgi:hypothetical protein
MDELPMIQGYALIAEATASNPWCAVEIEGDGYLAQERFRGKDQR